MKRTLTEDRPDLVPDHDALACRWSCYGMIGSKGLYHVLCELILGRKLSDLEFEECWAKMTHHGPIPYEDTWEGMMERIKDYPPANYWRSSI
jgi:hypothetical protein